MASLRASVGASGEPEKRVRRRTMAVALVALLATSACAKGQDLAGDSVEGTLGDASASSGGLSGGGGSSDRGGAAPAGGKSSSGGATTSAGGAPTGGSN